MHSYLDTPTPHVLAHQGLALNCHPNSIQAFRAALEAGADYIETDAHGTKDGVAVLFHDDDVDGITFNNINSENLPDYIPKLTDALKEFPHARFNIDIKNSEAAVPVARAVIEHNAQHRVLLTSFDAQRRKAATEIAKQTAISPSVTEFAPAFIGALLGLRSVVRKSLRNFDAIQIPARALGFSTVTPRLLRMYHDAGVKVHVWTINDPQIMQTLLEAGVDGIVTDRTDLALQVANDYR